MKKNTYYKKFGFIALGNRSNHLIYVNEGHAYLANNKNLHFVKLVDENETHFHWLKRRKGLIVFGQYKTKTNTAVCLKKKGWNLVIKVTIERNSTLIMKSKYWMDIKIHKENGYKRQNRKDVFVKEQIRDTIAEPLT